MKAFKKISFCFDHGDGMTPLYFDRIKKKNFARIQCNLVIKKLKISIENSKHQ